MGIHYDYKSKRGERAMLKEAKRNARLAAKRAKRLAASGPVEKEVSGKQKRSRSTAVQTPPAVRVSFTARVRARASSEATCGSR